MKAETLFFDAIEKAAFNKQQREIISSKLNENSSHVKHAKLFYSNLELAKTRASFIKNKTLDNLDKYLIEFEANFSKKGGKVLWLQDNVEAISEIAKLVEKKEAKNVFKNRAQLFDEIELSKELQHKGLEVKETDQGNFIQALASELPYHPIFPTLHKNFSGIQELLKSKYSFDEAPTVQQLADSISEEIKENLKDIGISLTAVNFLIADSGSAVVFENEANAAQLSALPKTQILLVGIEDIIPSINDLDLFLHLFSTHSTGNAANAYTQIISGPKGSDEIDGPEEMYVLLIDNGRSNVLAKTSQRSALGCIKCGACFNVCPVYKNIGGHAYQAVYNGPIGSILSPLMYGMEEYKYLSFASASSMECVPECPVKIDFPKLLQTNRTDTIKSSPPGKTEKLAIFFWKTAMLKRSSMDKGGTKLKNFMLRQFFKKSWGERREIPSVAPKSFNQIWRERKGIR